MYSQQTLPLFLAAVEIQWEFTLAGNFVGLPTFLPHFGSLSVLSVLVEKMRVPCQFDSQLCPGTAVAGSGAPWGLFSLLSAFCNGPGRKEMWNYPAGKK